MGGPWLCGCRNGHARLVSGGYLVSRCRKKGSEFGNLPLNGEPDLQSAEPRRAWTDTASASTACMSRGRRAIPPERGRPRILPEVHDIPAERLVEPDQDVEVAFRALFVPNIRAEDPDPADVIPLSKVRLRFFERIDDRPHGPVRGDILRPLRHFSVPP